MSDTEAVIAKDERIWRVYLMPNQMVAVFDHKGQQMPEYQGEKSEVWANLYPRIPEAAHRRGF